ncbi:MAG: sugar phosphate isomerase/epimerase [Vicinamibacterales bacterium]
MAYTRREFGKLTLAGLPAAAVFGRGESILGAFTRPSHHSGAAGQAQARPNSLVDGVQIGTISYSFRAMPDQSAEATLKYILDSGISAIELMGGPAERFAGAPAPGRGGGAGRAGGGRGPGGAAAGRGLGGTPAPLEPGAGQKIGEWHGQQCIVAAEGAAAAGAGAPRRGGATADMTPEQIAAQTAQREAAATLKAWRTSVSMDPFKKLRKMYNDAGVTIYAWKQLNPNMSDEEFEYVFNVAEALGCTHTTLELPTDEAQLKRIGDFAMKKKVYAAYHTHAQGGMNVFDRAFAVSKGNMANVDFGHWTAAGNVGGMPMEFLNKFHDRIASFHLKDRTTPDHCALNLPWGTGETPITEILQLVKKNKWRMPASVEMEYAVPEGSDPVQEVRKCVEYCRAALNAPSGTPSRRR